MKFLRGVFYAFLIAIAVILVTSIFAPQSFLADWIKAEMAPIMFASLVFFLLLGYPVAFSLSALGLLYAIAGVELGLFTPALLQALPNRVFGVMENDTLLAIPFFTFMGLILERSGMAEDLLDTIGQLFGPLPGGLAYAVIFVGALLAATTGVVAASVISMGLISLPIMLRYGYDRKLASGVIAASGTLAQIIPPSLVLIVLADQLGRSVGDMYKGAIIPGLVLTCLYVGYVFGRTVLNSKCAPALPPEARQIKEDDGSAGYTSLLVLVIAVTVASWALTHFLLWESIWAISFSALVAFGFAVANRAFNLGILSRLAQQVVIVMMPPLALIFLVLGTIFIGLATPTEGGAMGATGALLMAMANRRLDFALLKQAMDSTAKLTAFVIFILVGARVFSLSFYGVNGDQWVEHLLLGLPGGAIGLPDRRQHSHLPAGLLPRFLRAGLHHHPAAGAEPSRSRLGDRPHLVRRSALASTCRRRSCTRPSASRCSTCGRSLRGKYSTRSRQADGWRHDSPDLLGRGSLRLHPGRHGGDS